MVLGQLAANSSFALEPTQRDAWLGQLAILREQLVCLSGTIFFEFNIPRMGRRVDVVLLIGPMVFAIEFKVGEQKYDRASVNQVWDYALDLKNFHEASHDAYIAPILVATESSRPASLSFVLDADRVFRPVLTDAKGIREAIESGLKAAKGAALDAHAWSLSSYRPTPTIVEAARALYARHSVEAIHSFDAGA